MKNAVVKGTEFSENRTNRRNRFHYKALIEFGDNLQQRPCIIWDISQLGARISAETVADLPNTFDVVLAERGNVRRLCHVQWRFDNQLKVLFATTKEAAQSDPRNSTFSSQEVVLID
jgi:hypothetical protein